jgi:hypothetical protein
MEIHIKTIPHSEQRYDTCGDYFLDDNGVMQIRVSDIGMPLSEHLVAIHELIEVVMCIVKGITIRTIDDFDIAFEKNRKEGDLSEPGFDPEAPYRHEHAIATAVEMIICAHLGISWKEYEESINKLTYDNANVNIE